MPVLCVSLLGLLLAIASTSGQQQPAAEPQPSQDNFFFGEAPAPDMALVPVLVPGTTLQRPSYLGFTGV